MFDPGQGVQDLHGAESATNDQQTLLAVSWIAIIDEVSVHTFPNRLTGVMLADVRCHVRLSNRSSTWNVNLYPLQFQASLGRSELGLFCYLAVCALVFFWFIPVERLFGRFVWIFANRSDDLAHHNLCSRGYKN